MDEEFEQELYEEPDYNVWETNRVYEDMALDREQAEADALAEVEAARLAPIVAVLNGSDIVWSKYGSESVEDLARRILTAVDPLEQARKVACDHPTDVLGCSECDWAMRRR